VNGREEEKESGRKWPYIYKDQRDLRETKNLLQDSQIDADYSVILLRVTPCNSVVKKNLNKHKGQNNENKVPSSDTSHLHLRKFTGDRSGYGSDP
jgi:hypothetical protein